MRYFNVAAFTSFDGPVSFITSRLKYQQNQIFRSINGNKFFSAQN